MGSDRACGDDLEDETWNTQGRGMAGYGGGSFDAATKVNDALKLKIADDEVLISDSISSILERYNDDKEADGGG